ncbi:MAG: hypothetical protein H7301_03185, partial [Cryobacterium sp.]|nr:hypothetical protein [Oligoflexia bacterium]
MKENNFAKNLILPLFTLASSFSIPLASADFTSLSCYGIDDKWTSEANRILHLLEDQANAEVNHYVTMANFDIGSTNFGIQGAASLGHLQAPPFTCSDPKLTLKSGAPDFGITPNYLITARVFGMPVSIVDARMEGAQGQATAKNPSAPRPKHNVMFSLKVMGVDVLQQIVKGPETEAHTAQELQNLVGAPDPSALADKQKTGAGGKLFDFSRSISQMLRTKPRLDIVPGVLYVAVDAGFYLQSDLIFTYGVNTAIHDFRGSKQITSSLGMNPVKAADEICVAADSPGAACTNKTASVAAKDKNFFQTLASGVTSNFDRAKMLREQVRSQNLGELASRARIVRDSFRGDWDKLFDGSLDLNGKKSYIQSIPMSERMSPFADKTEKLKATGDAAKGISSDLSTTYSQVQKILATSQNGLPAVTADAGFAISGRAGAWASAVLAVDAVVVRGWAGILGYLTLIDVRMGVGAVLSTKSQYLDLTATMDTIRMAGGLNLIFGAEVGISPFVATFAGQRPLYVFPGSMTHKDVLVGRLDFRAGQTGKPALFWCTDIFGSATVDPDRCSDVDLPKAALAPAFAAYNDLKKDTLGEMIVDDAAGCIVSDGGKPIFSSPDASNCASILPATSTTALASTAAGVAHPLARYFNQDPESFMTDLRNAQNQPVKVFSANGIVNGEAGTPNSVIYAANSALSAPSVGGLGGRVLQFVEQLPLNNIADDSSLGARIYSLGSRAQYVSPATPIPGVTTYDLGDASVNGLLINMDWASSAGMWPTDWQAGITVVDPKIFVGDLGALPNNILADMGQNFRLGRCGVQSENNGSDFTINVSSRPFPYEGDIEGKVSENMTSTDDTCFMAGASSGMGDAKVAYTACTLRRALRTGECFPPERVIELVRLANLTNQDALKYFLGAAAGSPKLISGDIFPNGKVYDSYVDQQEIGFTVRCNTDACHRSILSDFFNSQYSGTVFTWPYVSDFNNPNANSDRVKRCNLLYTGDQDNSSSYEEHWFNREYLSGRNGTVIRLKSRGSATCFKVAATAGTVVQPNFSVGDSGACLTNAFHARYTAPYTNRMSPLICDPNNSGNRSRYADTALNGTGSNLKSQALATNADSTGTMGYYLARSVKRCIGNDHQCVYTPDGDTSDAAQLASSTCNMKVDQMVASGAGASLSVPGPGGTTSLNGCLQQASSPNFSDAAVFCNDSGLAAQLKTLFGINPNGTTAFNYSVRLTAAWDANRQVTNVADSGSHSEQEVGRCFLTRQAGSTLIEITGQTMSLPGRNLASAAGNSNCSLYIDKNSAATLIRSNPKDPIPALDPTSSDNKCAETLGFYGTTSDIQAKANEYCSNLSPSDTLDVFGGQTGLVRTGTLRYYITGGAPGTGAVRTQSCSVTHTDAEWTAALGGADCTLAFTPYGTSNAIAQTVLLPVTDANGHNGDRTACEAAINAQMTCAKIQAMSAYAPYAPGGATVSGKYGNTAVGSPSSRTCSGAYAPNGENSTSTSCKLAGWMTAPYQSSTREFDNTLLTTPAVAASLASSSNASSACQTAWSDRVAATNNGSSTNFLFCTSALSTVSSSLYSRRANWMNCTDDLSDPDNPFYCLLRGGNIWTTQDGNPPLASSGAGNYPISISFKSHYGSAAASSSNPLVTTCRYDFREVAGSSGSQWQLAAEGMPSYVTAEGASEKVCIRPSGNVPIDPANPNCALLPNGSTLLFGGAGPGLLAQTPSTAANPNYSSHQASTCSTFLPQMTAISDLVQNDPTKRLPMWVRTVDSLGRVTPPKEKDAADFYCSQNTSCNLVAEFGAESRNISLGFLQTWGITPTTSQACLGLNQSASGSTCIDLRADDSVPDNLPIDLYSVYGDERRLIQTCDVGTPKACVIGAARGSANDLYLMLEKPMGSGLLSLTGHQGSFGTSNTKQNCADYFDSDSYCGMDTPYTNDQNHPGESYGIYRQFGLDRSTQSTCYSALNLSIDAYEGNLRASWTDIHPNSGHYELQYCEGPGCIPGGITDSTHFNLMIPLADGVQKTTVTNPGVVYRYRARYVSDATSTPWSSTVDAMSPGTAMPPMQLATFTADIYEIPRDRIVFNWVPMNGTVSGFYEFGFCHGAGCDPTDGNSTNFTMAAPNG